MLSHSFTNLPTLLPMVRDAEQDTREALLRFMDQRGLKVSPWAERAGITEGTLRSFLAGGTRSMRHANLRKLAAAENVSVEQMLGRVIAPTVATVPVIDYVQAGNWREVVDAYQPGHGFDEIGVDRRIGQSAFALQIVGDSMEPDFREGDRIIVDPAVRPRPGDFVVAKVRPAEEATFKRYTTPKQTKRGRLVVELVPLNPAYPVLTMSGPDDEIVGTVVEHHRYFRR